MKLAERIFEDLCTRIESGNPPPCKLTFSALSDHYGVSLTPVRTAVKQLVAQGYLATLDNGRMQVSDTLPQKQRTKRFNLAEPPVDHEEVIRSDLIQLSLIGDSRYMREGAAAAKYSIGRTVLRPIFSRLAGQGLLEHVPRCGWRVRPFDKNDLCNFLIVRESLELAALEQARQHLETDVLRQFLDGNRGGANIHVGGLNNNLHSYWITQSGNRYIIDFFDRQAVYYTTLFDFAAPEAHVVAEMAAQHCEILESLINNQWNVAKKALVRHIRDQKPVVLKLLEQIQSQAVRTGT
jgi:DNA-binding GntR family transcriptional regulator